MASETTPADLPADTSSRRALTDLRTGDLARLHTTELAAADLHLLQALGLVRESLFRLCKAGDPWIVQVRGTRIGISDTVARRLQVVPEG